MTLSDRRTTMRVTIDSKSHRAVINSIQFNNSDWSLDCKLYKITDVSRIERTDYIQIELTEVEL